MGSYLVVAIDATGGAQLMAEVRRRIARAPSSFFVLVPVPESESQRHGILDGMVAGEAGPMVVQADLPRRADQEREVLERQSRGRLELLTREIRAAGGDADGDLGDPDPLKAIEREVRTHQFDEIILSTPPSGLSKWIRRDLPHRVERKFELPVQTLTPRG